MTTRREFLRKSSIIAAASLLLGPEALEAFERLTHRKVWALGGFGPILRVQRERTVDGTLALYLRLWDGGFAPLQSARYGFTGLGKALHSDSRRAMVSQQEDYIVTVFANTLPTYHRDRFYHSGRVVWS